MSPPRSSRTGKAGSRRTCRSAAARGGSRRTTRRSACRTGSPATRSSRRRTAGRRRRRECGPTRPVVAVVAVGRLERAVPGKVVAVLADEGPPRPGVGAVVGNRRRRPGDRWGRLCTGRRDSPRASSAKPRRPRGRARRGPRSSRARSRSCSSARSSLFVDRVRRRRGRTRPRSGASRARRRGPRVGESEIPAPCSRSPSRTTRRSTEGGRRTPAAGERDRLALVVVGPAGTCRCARVPRRGGRDVRGRVCPGRDAPEMASYPRSGRTAPSRFRILVKQDQRVRGPASVRRIPCRRGHGRRQRTAVASRAASAPRPAASQGSSPETRRRGAGAARLAVSCSHSHRPRPRRRRRRLPCSRERARGEAA